MTRPHPEGGSFRDPRGQVYRVGDRVLRTVTKCAAADFEFFQSCGLLHDLLEENLILSADCTDITHSGLAKPGVSYVLEHPKIPFISYPYEWPFAALKEAALLHLRIHKTALSKGMTLSDASAYNVQFIGCQPVFIDHLSFRRYRDGEFWIGHRQFCEQLLNPLVLRAYTGLTHNHWFRGSQEGITAEELRRIIPAWRKVSWNVFTHVVLQAAFQKSKLIPRSGESRKPPASRKLPRPAFERMLQRLEVWIKRLKPADKGKSQWADYAQVNTYSSSEAQAKAAFVSEFAATTKPKLVWDLGCNTGDYSQIALAAGAAYVVGFDADHGALDVAFHRAKRADLSFLPLFTDAANPTPSQGWNQNERYGLKERAPADALLALALVHHLAIARNIPIAQLVEWLVSLAPTGVFEYVPKDDPMVQMLLQLREDIFPTYTEQHFLEQVRSRSKIIKTQSISASGRTLVWYDTR